MSHRHLTGKVIPVPEGAAVPEYHLPTCFGCGPRNDAALGVRFRLEGDVVVSDFVFAPRFEGGPGVVHGGAAAAFLDDVMGSVLMAHHTPAVTARLEIDYLRPIPIGLSIRAEAWLAEDLGNKLWVEAVGRDAEGDVYLEARALFVPFAPDHFARAAASAAAKRAAYEEGEFYP